METDVAVISRLIGEAQEMLNKLFLKQGDLGVQINSQVEEVHRLKRALVQARLKTSNLCSHIYSRSINEPRPRLCVHCGEPEPVHEQNVIIK